MIERVISGGQAGPEQAGWRAARACGFPTGGWMALGYATEDGPRPGFAERYGATELPTTDPVAPARRNAAEAPATLWFGPAGSPGYWTTHRAAGEHGRSFLDVASGVDPAEVAGWLAALKPRALNVAGGRESSDPGIGDRVERFLMAVFLRALARG